MSPIVRLPPTPILQENYSLEPNVCSVAHSRSRANVTPCHESMRSRSYVDHQESVRPCLDQVPDKDHVAPVPPSISW